MKKLLILIFAFSLLCFVGCGGVEFKINFIVDDKVYATLNTNGAETIKMPDNPTKEDYTFDGWFWDKDTWQKPFTANSLLDAPLSSDMSVYAKWTYNGENIQPDTTPTEIKEYFEKQADGSYYGKVYNTTDKFDFNGKIQSETDFYVCKDSACTQILNDNTTSLNLGDNVFYILFADGNKTTATVRRRIICTVTFDTANGTIIDSQQVYEDTKATMPKNPMRLGYTFSAWDFDFNEPITEHTTITAIWNANKNTPYKIEYYLQNLEDDEYTLQENDTENLTGTTDTTAIATKTYEHFTVIENTALGNINADGTTVLKVYYDLEKFTVIITANDNVTLNKTYNGTYKYGDTIPSITATFNNCLGYEWQGWFKNDGFFTESDTITSFTVNKNINYIAKCTVKKEMENFIFSSTTNTCNIIEIKDKTQNEIIIPNYTTEINSNIFAGCSFLQSITLPFIGNNNYSIGYPNFLGRMFGKNFYTNSTPITQTDYNGNSGTYYFPNSLKTVNITGTIIANYAFSQCSNLTKITIPDIITFIGDSAFSGCNNLQYNEYENGLYLGNNNNPYVLLKNTLSKDLSVFTIHQKTKIIHMGALMGCNNLSAITIPESITSIASMAFDNCDSLTKVNYSGTIEQWAMIDGLEHLKRYNRNIYINNKPINELCEINLKNISKIKPYAFSNCSALTSVTISDNVTSIGRYAFSGCSRLTSITIPDSVTSIGCSAFENCPCIQMVDGISYVDKWIVDTDKTITSTTIKADTLGIADYSFRGCSTLTKIIIPNNVKSIGSHAFDHCVLLNSVTIGNNVTNIAGYAFYFCNKLTSIHFINQSNWKYGNDMSNLINVNVSNDKENATNFAYNYTSLWVRQ